MLGSPRLSSLFPLFPRSFPDAMPERVSTYLMTDSRLHEISALPLRPVDESPMVFIPSGSLKGCLGGPRTRALLSAQLEYYLIVVYKRALPGAMLPAIIEQRGEDSLGGLLKGIRNRGHKPGKQLMRCCVAFCHN